MAILGIDALGKLWKLSPDRCYPIEEVRRGLAQVIVVLESIPGVHSVEGWADHRESNEGEWQVHFHIDPAHPLAWDVLRHLNFAVNGYECANEFAIFRPLWDPSGPRANVEWTICPQVKRLDAALFAEYLRDRLPRADAEPAAWRG
jgi:hypothetical protein